MNAAGINALGTFSVGHDTFSLYRLDIGLATESDSAQALAALSLVAVGVAAEIDGAQAMSVIVLPTPGVFRTGNPRVWIVDSRQRYVHVDGRTRVIHLE